MVIFAHRARGFGKKDNSLAAVRAAVKKGISVEVDLRLKNGRVVLAHDAPAAGGNNEFCAIVDLMNNHKNILFALHLKEPSRRLFLKAGEAVKNLKNCFLLVTDFPQATFIRLMRNIVAKYNLALYVTGKKISPGLADKAAYFWMDETAGRIYDESDYFRKFKKKMIFCSPELFMPDYKRRLTQAAAILSKKDIFGVCTDFPYESTFCHTKK